MEEPFTKIVSQIFNNWTALRLAVEHSDKSNSKEIATEFVNYMVHFCLHENNVHLESIQDALEDILDEEFETICEDESPKQVANVLFKFLTLLKEGKTAECEIEFQNLPTANTQWLNQQSRVQEIRNGDSSSDSNDISPEAPMEDDGWTEVKGRKKK